MREAGRGLRIAAGVLVPLGVVLAAGFGFVYARFGGVTVMSDAMRPTYMQGEQLVVERVGADEIRTGDVVLVDVPGRPYGGPTLQRVVGVGGDEVSCCDGGRVSVNGQALDEPYVEDGEPAAGSEPYDVRVPEGRLFLLGDHRGNANDSRFFLDDGQSGTVAAGDVRGRVCEGCDAVPVLLLATGAGGAVSLLAGIGLGIGGYVTGRRARRAPVPVGAWPGY
ncbi:signal peptidase I [Streptomyces sp. TRM66268-LWL]|uniref:Signal peptidase I n=1 Tax=Streptomyces polyasparticus TaxID=2767826 RepID=A0ABR7SP84_9ACTN|nr:signal peptidase I [Streptomyces polyasparticus]MBC9716729.1 signal peptidase I [Streptomyces polyasparticus]